jgi:hypothetical protein
VGTFRLAFAAAAILLSSPSHVQQTASAPAAPACAQEANWFCVPERSDPCGQPLPTTALNANGYDSVGQSDPAKNGYWFAGPAVTSSTTPIQWSSSGPPPTAFLRTEGLVSAACVNKGPLATFR